MEITLTLPDSLTFRVGPADQDVTMATADTPADMIAREWQYGRIQKTRDSVSEFKADVEAARARLAERIKATENGVWTLGKGGGTTLPEWVKPVRFMLSRKGVPVAEVKAIKDEKSLRAICKKYRKSFEKCMAFGAARAKVMAAERKAAEEVDV